MTNPNFVAADRLQSLPADVQDHFYIGGEEDSVTMAELIGVGVAAAGALATAGYVAVKVIKGVLR